jgi:hypothetical protein
MRNLLVLASGTNAGSLIEHHGIAARPSKVMVAGAGAGSGAEGANVDGLIAEPTLTAIRAAAVSTRSFCMETSFLLLREQPRRVTDEFQPAAIALQPLQWPGR